MGQRVRVVLRGRLSGRDPLLFWLGRVAVNSRVVYGGAFRRFLVWLNQRAEWLGVDARGLLMRQLEAQAAFQSRRKVCSYLSYSHITKP